MPMKTIPGLTRIHIGPKRIKSESGDGDPVEVIATRKVDKRTLAIEHTLIQPCLGERDDLASFAPFHEIGKDLSLRVPGRRIDVTTLQSLRFRYNS